MPLDEYNLKIIILFRWKMSVSKPIIVDNIDAVLRSGAVSTVDVSCSLRKHFQLFFCVVFFGVVCSGKPVQVQQLCEHQQLLITVFSFCFSHMQRFFSCTTMDSAPCCGVVAHCQIEMADLLHNCFTMQLFCKDNILRSPNDSQPKRSSLSYNKYNKVSQVY